MSERGGTCTHSQQTILYSLHSSPKVVVGSHRLAPQKTSTITFGRVAECQPLLGKQEQTNIRVAKMNDCVRNSTALISTTICRQKTGINFCTWYILYSQKSHLMPGPCMQKLPCFPVNSINNNQGSHYRTQLSGIHKGQTLHLASSY